MSPQVMILNKLLTVVSIVCSVTAMAQSPIEIRKAKLNELSFLFGTWQISGESIDAKGNKHIQTGTMKWGFDMDSTVIRNDREFIAAGDSKAPRSANRFYEYIMFSPARNMYEFISFEFGGASAARYWLVDVKKKIYRYTFARFDASAGVTIETIVTLKFINENKLIETFEDIVFETGERSALNTLTLTRMKG